MKVGIFLKLKARQLLVHIYIVAFLAVTCWAAAAQLVFLPRNILWETIGLSEKVLIAFYILLGFCAILLAFWIDVDGMKLEELEKRVKELEKKQRRPTPDTA